MQDEENHHPESLEQLREWVRRDFGEMLRLNVYVESFFGIPLAGKNLDGAEERQRIRQRERLRIALRHCGTGDLQAKSYVLEHVKELLVTKYQITEPLLDKIIPASSGRDCFARMLYQYRKRYQDKAVERLFSDYDFLRRGREVTEEIVLSVYRRFSTRKLSFPEKLELAAQRIYEDYKGNGVADEWMEMDLDGVSGGVSGRPFCLWILFQGISIRLSFLTFSSDSELERVCKNICRGHRMGQLSEKKGFLVTELADGSRVSVARPPFCESWVFFIRKFRLERLASLEELIIDAGGEEVIRFLRWLVRGERLIAITGEQGAGKTTLLAALVNEIPEWYNIRVQELAFELQLRKRYPKRNVVSFRETESVSGQEGLDFAKKTDGVVTILGEVASAPVVRFLVQLAQNASAFTMFTHHARTTEDLVCYIRNALLQEGGFHREAAALAQAASSVQFDIHLGKSADGIRYVESVTEICRSGERGEGFETRLIIKRVSGRYQFQNAVSKEGILSMQSVMTLPDQDAFLKDVERWWGCRGKILV